MKKLISAVVVLSALIMTGARPALAGHGEAIGFFWRQHDQAVAGILTVWRSGEPHTAYISYLQDLVSSEAGLLGYRIQANHPKLYGRLAEGISGSNPEIFAWRVFQERLRERGIQVGQPTATFAYSTFLVREVADGRSGRVRF